MRAVEPGSGGYGVASNHARAGPQVWPQVRPQVWPTGLAHRSGPQVWPQVWPTGLAGSVPISYLRSMRTTSPYPRRKKLTQTGPSNVESGPSFALRVPIRHQTTPLIHRTY